MKNIITLGFINEVVKPSIKLSKSDFVFSFWSIFCSSGDFIKIILEPIYIRNIAPINCIIWVVNGAILIIKLILKIEI